MLEQDRDIAVTNGTLNQTDSAAEQVPLSHEHTGLNLAQAVFLFLGFLAAAYLLGSALWSLVSKGGCRCCGERCYFQEWRGFWHFRCRPAALTRRDDFRRRRRRRRGGCLPSVAVNCEDDGRVSLSRAVRDLGEEEESVGTENASPSSPTPLPIVLYSPEPVASTLTRVKVKVTPPPADHHHHRRSSDSRRLGTREVTTLVGKPPPSPLPTAAPSLEQNYPRGQNSDTVFWLATPASDGAQSYGNLPSTATTTTITTATTATTTPAADDTEEQEEPSSASGGGPLRVGGCPLSAPHLPVAAVLPFGGRRWETRADVHALPPLRRGPPSVGSDGQVEEEEEGEEEEVEEEGKEEEENEEQEGEEEEEEENKEKKEGEDDKEEEDEEEEEDGKEENDDKKEEEGKEEEVEEEEEDLLQMQPVTGGGVIPSLLFPHGVWPSLDVTKNPPPSSSSSSSLRHRLHRLHRHHHRHHRHHHRQDTLQLLQNQAQGRQADQRPKGRYIKMGTGQLGAHRSRRRSSSSNSNSSSSSSNSSPSSSSKSRASARHHQHGLCYSRRLLYVIEEVEEEDEEEEEEDDDDDGNDDDVETESGVESRRHGHS